MRYNVAECLLISQKAQPQKVVRVECNGLHAVVISRFLYDCTYFGKEVMAMIEAVTGTAKSQPHKPDKSGYKSIFEVRSSGNLLQMGVLHSSIERLCPSSYHMLACRCFASSILLCCSADKTQTSSQHSQGSSS